MRSQTAYPAAIPLHCSESLNFGGTVAMLICQHIKFGPRILFLLLLIAFTVFYFYLNIKSTYKQKGANKLHISQVMGKVSSLTPRTLQTNRTFIKNWQGSYFRAKNNVFSFGNNSAEIKLAVVLCGERLNQTVVTLKSAIILSKTKLHYIIIADKDNREKIRDKLLDWPLSVLNRLSFEIHLISFPNGTDGDEWRNLFKLCACQRLFLPTLLRHIDSLIYVDTDVLFMHPVENLWQYFHKMNRSQIAALAPEHEDFATGWYNRFARHPYYEPLGVNSGVMLMNLTKMRDFNWESYLRPVMKEYKLKIVWGDQDIINIIFHFHPEKLLIFPCEWNYRPDHCMYSSVCKTAEKHGVKVIHGNRGVYQNNKQPVFKAIYDAMASYNISSGISEGLLAPMKAAITGTSGTNCGKLSAMLVASLFDSFSHKKEVR